MTDPNITLDRIARLSAAVRESAELLLKTNAKPTPEETPILGEVTTRVILINGMLLQQAALDVALENTRAQLRIAAAAEEQALTHKTLMEELSNLASDVGIIAGQNAGGYQWNPQLSVEIANAADLR